ncbi:MAG: hypothetical protein ACT4PM_13985 [Gemmatimonadales bacterium]
MHAASGLVAGLLLAAACGSTEPEMRSGIEGNFGTPLADRNGYLAVSLFERGGFVTGRAWSNFSGTLIGGATVTGEWNPPDVALDIHPLLPFGVVDWHLVGQLQGDTLKGEFSTSGLNPQRVELPRVRSVPSGQYTLAISGAVADTARGWAVFSYGGGSFRLVQVFTIAAGSGSSMVVFWQQRDRPAPGTYPVSAEGGPAPAVRFAHQAPEGPELRYTVQDGRLVIETSERYVLAGRFLMTASDTAGRIVTLHGIFSAGCSSNAC